MITRKAYCAARNQASLLAINTGVAKLDSRRWPRNRNVACSVGNERLIAEAAPFPWCSICKPYPPGVLPYGLWRVSCIDKTAGRIVAELPMVGITVASHTSGKLTADQTSLEQWQAFIYVALSHSN